MSSRLNPWVVVLTAALTFGSLMAFVGPRSFGHRPWGYRGYYSPNYRSNHGGCDAYYGDKVPDKTQTKPTQP